MTDLPKELDGDESPEAEHAGAEPDASSEPVHGDTPAAEQASSGDAQVLADEVIASADEVLDDDAEVDNDEDDPDDVAAWEAYGAVPAVFPDIPAQRFGRRGFLFGLAAAGVPIAGLVKLMEQAGGGGSSVPAPMAPQAAPTLVANPGASPVASPIASPVASPEASPAASPVATPVDPFGELTVVRDQVPRYIEAPQPSGTLTMMLTMGDNLDFNPTAFNQDFQVAASYLDPLVWIDDQTMEPKPWLASNWRIDDDGSRIIFTLRDDVTWHDGSPLTPEDVVFSLLAYRDDTNSAVRNLFVTMNDAKVVGTRSIAVELSGPDANFIPNAASQFIFQQKLLGAYWEDRPEGQRTLSGFDWEKNPPVGTGPWVFAQSEKRSLTFERNETYWAGDPAHFETLVFTWDTDPRTRIEAWRNKQADVLFPIRANELEFARDRPGLLYAADSPVVMFAQFNLNNPARAIPDQLADVRVRRALSLAIDRSRYAREIFLGCIDINGAGTFPQPWLRDEALVNPPRNRRDARALLNDAGYERRSDGTTLDPNGEPFVLNVITRMDARFEMRLALRSIADDLGELGISLRVEELGDEAFNDRWTVGHDFDLIAFSYQVYPGFTDFDLYGTNWDIRINPQGWNPGGYSNADVDKAIRAALNAPSLDELVTAVTDLQVAANDDLFALWLGFPQDLVLIQPDVLGFQPTMNWQTWHTRKLWRRPAGAPVPENIFITGI